MEVTRQQYQDEVKAYWKGRFDKLQAENERLWEANRQLKANHNEHTGRMYEMANKARREGRIEGLSEYAWWKDGVQYVGTCGTTLKEALKGKTNDN